MQFKCKLLQKQQRFDTVVKKRQIENIEANGIKSDGHRKTAAVADLFAIHKDQTLRPLQDHVDRKFGWLKQPHVHTHATLYMQFNQKRLSS